MEDKQRNNALVMAYARYLHRLLQPTARLVQSFNVAYC
jgi:hypothetical protein